MRQDIASDLSSSAQAFVASVWPVIRTRLGGTIEPVETVTTVSMARSLDIEAGIDFWHIRPGIGMRGIGSRVQWVDRAYPTFTIRKARPSGAKTEYEKRCSALAGGKHWLYPALMVHAYLANPKGSTDLLAVGMAATRDVFAVIADGEVGKDYRVQINRSDKVEFLVVEWAAVEPIWTWFKGRSVRP